MGVGDIVVMALVVAGFAIVRSLAGLRKARASKSSSHCSGGGAFDCDADGGDGGD